MLTVRNALRQRRLEVENRALRARVDRRLTIVGDSPVMRRLRDQIEMTAPSNGRVLISGENGTGKELVARQIHALSHRRTGPFVEVNCAAIPEELIESELFGHTKGAFTGAVADRRGRFENATTGGTLFLDEVGDMSLKTQAKVLRALQEQIIEPVGGQRSVRVDVRVIAATNKDLVTEMQNGRFREDLYFRLNVIPMFVPALRDRGDDVIRLAEHFVSEFAKEYGRRPKRLSLGAMVLLREYRWPGNVRELRNVIERLMITVPGELVVPDDLGVPRHRRGAGHGRQQSARFNRCSTRATPGSAATSSARSPRSTATSPERPRRSASSAATSTRRCAASALRPDSGKKASNRHGNRDRQWQHIGNRQSVESG